MDGNVQFSAAYASAPKFATSAQRKETAAQANGRRYDEKVGIFIRSFALQHGYQVKDHPWIEYRGNLGRVQYCQPDYVLLSSRDDNLIIIEAKLRHTREAVVQLRRYNRLIGLLHPEFKPSLVEICRYCDLSECRMELLPELRPHNYDIAAVIFEPNQWTAALN